MGLGKDLFCKIFGGFVEIGVGNLDTQAQSNTPPPRAPRGYPGRNHSAVAKAMADKSIKLKDERWLD